MRENVKVFIFLVFLYLLKPFNTINTTSIMHIKIQLKLILAPVAGLMLLSFSILLHSCTTDCRQPEEYIDDTSCLLTTEEAVDIFNASMESHLKRGIKHGFGRFFLEQDILSVNWSKANRFYVPKIDNDNAEAPFLSKYSLQFYIRDRLGRNKLLESDQRILIVRDRQNSAEGAFVMTIVADPDYTNKRNTRKLNKFHNNGDFTDFSGLIIYSRLSGSVVRVDRYLSGGRVHAVSMQQIKSKEDMRERVAALSRAFGVIRVRRVLSYLDTRCYYGCSPDDSCAHPDDNGYWNNDSTPIPLDSAGYCLADTVAEYDPDGIFGSGSSWGNDWLPDGYWDNEPDPSPGGGGGSNVGGGNNGSGGTTYNMNVDGKSLTVTLSSKLSSDAISRVKAKLNSLAGDEYFKKLVQDIDWKRAKVIVLPQSEFTSYQSGMTKSKYSSSFIRYEVEICLNPDGDYYGYLEEFFHAEQYLSAKQKVIIGDMEFEAKAFLAKIFSTFTEDEQYALKLRLNGNDDYFTSIFLYVDNYGLNAENDEINRINAVGAFIHMGYLGFEMSDDARNLDEILTNYYKFFSNK